MSELIEEAIRLMIPLLGFGVLALWIAGRFVARIVESWRVHRALELRMAERLALVQRGVDPATQAPLTPSRPGSGAGI